MNVHEKVTQKIVSTIEAGINDNYHMPWHSQCRLPKNIVSGKHYQGVNTLSLWAETTYRGYDHAVWGTYRQWQSKGCQVLKGQKASPIIFWKTIPAEETDDNKARFILRQASVFAADQVSGYEAPKVEGEDNPDPLEANEAVDAWVAATQAKITFRGTRAGYRRKQDDIIMPRKSLFRDGPNRTRTESMYAVLFHEMTHWTAPRVERELPQAAKDMKARATEELIAELGAAFLSAEHGFSAEPREDHAQYIESWLTHLKNDPRMIFKAASAASKAVNFLNAFSKEVSGLQSLEIVV